jgi:hypothetical protein
VRHLRFLLLPIAGVVVFAVFGACGGSEAQPPMERVAVTEHFPVMAPDLVARVGPARTGPETGELTLRIMDVPGVRLAETDYEAGIVRIIVSSDVDGPQVREALAALPGIVAVE